jgi:acetate---CoA ligase (ADP-forming)
MTGSRGDLARLVTPQSIAVLGASNKPGHFANQPLVNLRRYGFHGEVFPVNPKNDDVAGYRCYADLAEIPRVPDLAVIVLRADAAVVALRQCAELGVGGAVIVGSGFAETNSDKGRALQRELADVVRRSDLRLCGPNTLGIANFHTGAVSYASGNLPGTPRVGPIAVVSQSGGCSFTLLNRAWRTGIGVGHVAVAGNELDISIPEFVEFYLRQPNVKSVACYMEAVRDVHGLQRIGSLAHELGKSVFIMKSGRSESGRRAAAAHTGALATSDAVCDTAFEQWGLVRAGTFDELIAGAALAARFGPAEEQRFGVYAQGGGVAVVASDLFAAADLTLADLSPSTATRLKQRMPDITPGNPFDSGGQFLSAGAGVLTDALCDFTDDPNVTSVVHMLMPVAGTRLAIYTEGIVNAATQSAKPGVVLQYGAGEITQEATDKIVDAGLLLLDPPEAGVSALRLWSGSSARARRVLRRTSRRTPTGVTDRAHNLIAAWRAAGRRSISEHDAGELLQEYGIDVVRQLLVTDAGQVVDAAESLRSPYVVKIVSDEVPHRSDIGGVVLGVEGASEACRAYQSVIRNAQAAFPDAGIRGVTISETAPAGLELIVGVSQDSTFGPAVMVGLGGIHAEVFKDAALRLPPIDDVTASEMVGSLRGSALLYSLRGRPGRDIEAVMDVVIRLGELALDLGPELTALEMNPLIVGANGQGAVAVDALIELADPPGHQVDDTWRQ